MGQISTLEMKLAKAIALLILVSVPALVSAQIKKAKNMKVAVWDTYVTKKDKTIMHFDIIVPSEMKDTTVIYNYGKTYLKSKGQEGQPLSSKECRFCHIETVKPDWQEAVEKQGYFIYEMENCK